jgi:hypothetical protein
MPDIAAPTTLIPAFSRQREKENAMLDRHM